MSFYLGTPQTATKAASGNGGYGLGTKKLEVSSEIYVNRYAKVTAITAKQITVGGISDATGVSNKATNSFKAGEEVLIHVAAYKGAKTDCPTRGMWKTAYITAKSGSNITLSKSVSALIPEGFVISDFYIQVITLPHFKSVTLKGGGTITCPQFNKDLGYGGVVAFKCKEELVLEGGHIDLGGKGLPDGTLWEHGFVPFEPAKLMTVGANPWNGLTTSKIDTWRDDTLVTNNIHTMAGLENYRTLKHLTLNYPDGAAFIMAQSLVCDDDHKSRIGYTGGAGVIRVRSTKARGIIGGSSILLVANEIHGWTDSNGIGEDGATFISKYPSAVSENNRGCGRCYIATETTIPTDEGLYALDRISTLDRVQNIFNLSSFGNGKNGEFNNKNKQINNYASVIKIENDGNKFTLGDVITGGEKNFEKNALILIHATQKKYTREGGRCMFAYIGSYDSENKVLTLKYEKKFQTSTGDNFNLNRYDVQIITVPQYSSFTLSGEYNKVPKFENGRGGIVVICVNGTCDLSGGKINVEKKGCDKAYGTTGLRFIGNAQMAEKLPLGQGHGSVLILAETLKMNESTRIGATYSGLGQGGINRDSVIKAGYNYNYAGGINTAYAVTENGDPRNYPGQNWEGNEIGTSKTFEGAIRTYSTKDVKIEYELTGTTGGGKYYGNYTKKDYGSGTHTGGYGSNSSDGAPQGAHVLIIADTIEGFNISAISTGGAGGNAGTVGTQEKKITSENGGASHGGSGASGITRGGNGGFIGGGGGGFGSESPSTEVERHGAGGGSGGFCFVYCNNRVSQNTTGISFD